MPRVRRAYASLNKRGEIALSAEAFGHLGDTWYVALSYDPQRRTISIRSRVRGEIIYFVRRHGRGGRMRLVSAIRLLKEFDIKIERTLIFDPPWLAYLNDGPMIVLALDRATFWRSDGQAAFGP